MSELNDRRRAEQAAEHNWNPEPEEDPEARASRQATQDQAPNLQAVPDEDLLAGLRNGEWLDQQNIPPLKYAVDRIIPEGFTILAGAPKIGKSWLVYDTLLAISAGQYAFGSIQTANRPVFLLALEDGDRRLQSRARSLKRPLNKNFDYLTKVPPETSLATVHTWLTNLKSTDGAVVAVDTLQRARPTVKGSGNAYELDYAYAAKWQQLADEHQGTSILGVHHTKQARSADFVENTSGSSGLTGAADSVLTFDRGRGEDVATLRVTGRDILEGAYQLERNGTRWELSGGSLDAATTAMVENEATHGLSEDSQSTAVIHFVSECSDEATSKDVADACGIPANQARAILSRLAAAGRIRRTERGLYTMYGDES